jgi:hypothetical protein
MEELLALLREVSTGMINQASIDRGAKWIEAMKFEFPIAHKLVMGFLYKSPGDVLATLGSINPGFKQFRHNAHAVEFIRKLQESLRGKEQRKIRSQELEVRSQKK